MEHCKMGHCMMELVHCIQDCIAMVCIELVGMMLVDMKLVYIELV